MVWHAPGVSRRTLVSLLYFGNAALAVSYTTFVDLFIGTASGANGASGGNAFPGSAVPHAMVKVRHEKVSHRLDHTHKTVAARSALTATRFRGKQGIFLMIRP